MSTAVQRRRGTTAQHVNFTGLPAELTVDTSKNVVVVHDGVTPGGHALAPEVHNHTVAQISDASTIGKVILTAANAAAVAAALGLGSAAFASTGDFAAPIHSHPLSQLQQTGATAGQVATWDGAEWAPLDPAAANPTHAQVLAALGYTPANLGGDNFTGIVRIGVADNDTGLLIKGSATGVRMGPYTGGARIEGVDNTGTTSYQPLQVGGSYVAFTINSSEKMRLDANGRLGIGTSGPAFGLDVLANGFGARFANSSTAQFAAGGVALTGPSSLGTQGGTLLYTTNQNAGGTQGAFAIAQADYNGGWQRSLAVYDYQNQYWAFDTNGLERVRIDSLGQVGVGLNNPAARLHAYTVDGPNQVLSQSGFSWAALHALSHGSEAAYLLMGNDTNGENGRIGFWNDFSMVFGNGPSGVERARISSNGNLLVGTTVDSGHRLHVGGSVGISDGVNAKLAIYSDGANKVTIEAFDQSNTAKKLIALAPYGGRVLIGGAADTGALLAVNGVIESTSGGVKFPDATTQTTAVVAGTGANQALQIGADGKLPAIDGSKLTGIVAGGKAANRQVFTSSGTWTKPSGFGANAVALIQVWGGGGSGAKAGGAGATGGGGGGAYNQRWVSLASLGATETVTVGAGGASVTGAFGDGAVGGTSSFGAWSRAYGGGGGSFPGSVGGGGGGGGPDSAGAVQTPGAPSIIAYTPDGVSFYAVGSGAGSGTGPLSGYTNHGGGGASAGAQAGASALNGGGGGGGGGTGAGGISGAGGNGGASGVTGTAGSAPAGGGGGSGSGASGAGGRGEVRITIFDGV